MANINRHIKATGAGVTRLELWRRLQNVSYAELGRQLGRTREVVRRYCQGSSGMGREVGQKLKKLTNGLIHAGNYDDIIKPDERCKCFTI